MAVTAPHENQASVTAQPTGSGRQAGRGGGARGRQCNKRAAGGREPAAKGGARGPEFEACEDQGSNKQINQRLVFNSP